MMKTPGQHRRVTIALLLSALLHGLGVWLAHVLIPLDFEERAFRVRLPVRRMEIKRLKSRPPLPVPHQFLERLRAAEGAPDLEIELATGEEVSLPEVEIPLVDEGLPLVGKEKPSAVERDTLNASLDHLEQVGELPLDLVELDAEARERTVVLLDPDTGKLKKAYLHIPCYRNSRDRHGGRRLAQTMERGWHGGRELAQTMKMIERGERLPSWPPFENQIHWYNLGDSSSRWIPVEGEPAPDPIHRFPTFYGRQKLTYQEVKKYPFLATDYIDVESTDVMIRYLMEGGFALLNGGQYYHLKRELERTVEKRLETVRIGLGHPVFHAYYDVTEYRDPNGTCPSVGPLWTLRLDGRLIAITGVPRFNLAAPCLSNQLYVNALVYGLVQPSRMGGRYIARKWKVN